MSESVLYQPQRGHQCQHLRRWVTADDYPYAVPVELADRYVRANLGAIVGGVDLAAGQDVTATAVGAPAKWHSTPETDITPDEQAALEVKSTDPRTWTKAELTAALGLGDSAKGMSKRELLAMYLDELDGGEDGEDAAS